MKDDLLNHIRNSDQIGYAFHQLITDKNNKPIDYVFLDVNKGFELFTGLQSKNILNRPICKVIPKITEDDFNWIEFYGDIALNGGKKNIEQYSDTLKRWYTIEVFSDKKGYFSTLFIDSSEKQKHLDQDVQLFNISKELLELDGEIPYQKITDVVCEISGAKYGVFNLYSEDGKTFVNKSLSGFKNDWSKATKLLGFDLYQKTWNISQKRLKEVKDSNISKYKNVSHLANEVLPNSVCYLIEKTFSLGYIYVIEISYNSKIIGDFIILFKKGDDIQNPTLISSIANVVGVVLEKEKTKQKLIEEHKIHKETSLFYDHVLESIQDGISILKPDLTIIKTNSKLKEWYSQNKAVKGQKCFEAYQNRLKPCEKCPVLRSLKSAQVEMDIISGPHGHKTRYFELYAYPMKSEETDEIIAVIELTREITKQYKTQKALEISQTNFKNFFNSHIDFHWILDLNGNIYDINKTVVKRLEYTKEELIGQSVLMVHPENRHKEALDIIEEMMNGKKDFCPVPLQTKSKQLIPVETYVWKGIWNKQEVIFGVSKDISALKKSEEKFATAFNSNPAISGISDIETGKYIIVNNAFCEKLEYSREEAIGTKASMLLNLDDNFRKETIPKLIAESSVRNLETTITTKSGKKLNILLSADLIEIQNKKYNFTTAIDITDRKRAESNLFIEKQRLANIIEGTGIGTWEWNVQTGETRFNEKWAQMIGYSLAELEPTSIKTWEKFAHPDDLRNSMHDLEKHFNGEKNYYDLECRMKHRNGQWIWVLDRGKVISWTEDGKPLWMFGTHWEITDRKNAERALIKQNDKYAKLNHQYIKLNEQLIKAKNRAEESDRLKSAFLANMSHEIRTPMNAIVGFSSFLLEEDFSDIEKRQYAKTIIKNGDYLLKLINDIIDVSKIDAGKVSIVKKPLNLNNLCLEMATLFEAQIYKKELKNLKLKTNIPNHPVLINTDETRIRQILINLINNAIKFTEKGEVEFGFSEESEYVKFFVKDTGIGIPYSQQSDIFERFHQATDETEKFYGGTGLGLSIVKSFVELLNGKIWVESQPQKGSSFFFTIMKQ